MSNVSAKAEHLIRAALKGIEKNPDSWLQEHWVCTPEDARYHKERDDPGVFPECGTSYCLGGWMMLYDGWRHKFSSGTSFRNIWIKGEFSVNDPYWGYLKDIVYGDDDMYLFGSIFSADIDMPEILARIDDQLEINFEEDCPCLTEADTCNLQGCPCGTHTSALDTQPMLPTPTGAAMTKVIENMVKECAEAGDPISIRQILDDPILMNAFRAMFLAGEDSMVGMVTKKAERRISEFRVRLEAEVREITQSRDRVIGHNSLLQETVRRFQDQGSVIRKLQGQVDDLRSGRRETPEFAKLTAKVRRLEEENQAMTLNGRDVKNRFNDLRKQLADQKRVVAEVQLLGRREGQQVAIAAWQKALDIVRKEENL